MAFCLFFCIQLSVAEFIGALTIVVPIIMAHSFLGDEGSDAGAPQQTQGVGDVCELSTMQVATIQASMLGHNTNCSYNISLDMVLTL